MSTIELMSEPALPVSCVPSSASAELAEVLYCTYLRAMPGSLGMSPTGFPAPTWAGLLEAAKVGQGGAITEVVRWRSVADATSRTHVSAYQDALALPMWGQLQMAGRETLTGIIRPTNLTGVVEVVQPAVDGDAWHLPLPVAHHLRPITGPMFFGLTKIAEAEAIAVRQRERAKRNRAEREAATSAVLSEARVGEHALVWMDYAAGRQCQRILSITPPEDGGSYWRVGLQPYGIRQMADEPVALVPVAEADSTATDDWLPL